MRESESEVIDLADAEPGLGAAWGDFDNDGLLDLFVGNANYRGSFLYHNLGDGAFEKMSPENSLTEPAYTSGAVWGDYDNDGRLDLFVSNYGQSFLFHNEGEGIFARVTSGNIAGDVGSAVGCAWGDYSNDGFLDLFVANEAGENNALYRNDGAGGFTRITTDAVVNDAGNSTQCAWGDYDNDGWLDLFVANRIPYAGQNNLLYHNNGDGAFTKVLTGSLVNDPSRSFGCAWGDYDNDGFIDLAVANAFAAAGSSTSPVNFFYHNNGNANNWITIKCVGSASNRAAIGAKVRVKAILDPNRNPNPTWQLREISGGSVYCSQNDLRAAFGLGSAAVVDTVRIEWPSGIVQELHNVASRQFLTVWESPSVRAATQEDGACLLIITAEPNRTWRIEASTNLKVWHELATVSNTTTVFGYIDSASVTMASRFYRVVAE